MKRAIPLQMAICMALFLLVVTGTAQAKQEPVPIKDCTTITEPGSYVVTENITATPNNLQSFVGIGVCILIKADFVTLDLGGFAITGSNLGSTFATGIATDKDYLGIYVHSGTVAKFTGGGVYLTGSGHTVEHIRAIKNGSNGITVFPLFPASQTNGNRIIGNTVISNGGVGIFVSCPGVVLENSAAGNTVAPQISFTGNCTMLENNPAP